MLDLQAAAALIEKNYRVGEVEKVKELRNGPGSLVWMVNTCIDPTGYGKQYRYCLKHHRHNDAGRLATEHAAVSALNSYGFWLMPTVIPSTTGDTMITVGDDLYALYPYIESDTPFNWTTGGWTIEQSAAAGETLAKFHSAAQHIDSVPLPTLPATQLIDWGLGILRTCSRYLPDPTTLALSKFEDLVRSAYVSFDDDSYRGMIHGDFHPGNLLFQGNNVVAVLDTDYFRMDSRLFDIAYACTSFALDDLDHRKSHALLAQYNKTLLSSVEWTQLLPAMRLSAWEIALWLVNEARHNESKLRACMPVIERCMAILSASLD